MENTYLQGRGYDPLITALTEIDNKVIEQKFYTIENLSDYFSVEVGRGGMAEQLLTWVTSDVAGDFDTGFISNVDEARTASVDVNIDSMVFHRLKWAKKVSYNQFEIEQIRDVRGLNLDLIEQKLAARKRNWDLGIQRTMFVGNAINPNVTGLLNNPNVTVDTTILTKPISGMTPAEVSAVVGQLLGAYYKQTNNTALPNTLLIPTSDYFGLTSPTSAEFPLISKLQYLTDALNGILAGYGMRDFKILPVAYADADNQENPVGKNIYVLYNRNIDTLVYDMAFPFTTTPFNSPDNFNFYNQGYGMVGSLNIYRPQAVLYFQY